MHILKADSYRRTPWKNGGGETSEIAVHPEGAGFDDFSWRVSMARVAADGPFSAFPGIDRTLSVLEGKGIALDIDVRDPVVLTADSEPLRFAADATTFGRLVDGPISDLNVMTRRGRFDHRVTRRDVDGRIMLVVSGASLLFCAGPGLRLAAEGVA
ncbi:HutD/Ves family protein, partial [Mesorhizobium marinum]|uniref:HutD/Ves family protein n=1 Tax=Mesorhizobium marinum TaxID=3228790 RepID=UPI003465A302